MVGKEAVIAILLRGLGFMSAVSMIIAISFWLANCSGFVDLLSLFRSLSQGKQRNRYQSSADTFAITAQHLHFFSFFSKQSFDIRC